MFATLHAPAVGDDIRIECFRGTEALCRPYEFVIQFTVLGQVDLDLAAVIGSDATLQLTRDEEEPHIICGIFATARLVAQTPEWALFEAKLVPKLWRLGLTRHSRVFTKKSVPDIIKEVLESSDLTDNDFEFRLQGDYEEEELVVQYQESRLDFIHRWMEHEGIYYFFEHSKDDGAKMVICDANSAHSKMVDKTVRYRPTTQHDGTAAECFDSFTVHHSTTVKTVRLADYDYSRPALDVSATHDVSPHGVGMVSVHSARFFDPTDAQQFAKVRAEELKAREVVQYASGTALHLGAGYLVELAEHPNNRLNTEYLITEVVHFCNQLGVERPQRPQGILEPEYDEVYRVQVTALDKRIQFRPPLTTPTPRVWGIENGIVDGEADSPYAQIDDAGRYLVKFQFDESDLNNGKASTYVRMVQPHGGTTEGFHFPLRKGTEVVFTFLGGDPDRPVIAGVVPNATTPSPVTSANHTQNVLRTGANNHFILDDAQGAEFISMRTPRDNTGLYFGNPIGAAIERFDGEGRRWNEGPAGSVWLYTDGTTSFTFGGQWWITCRGIDEWTNGSVKEVYIGEHSTTVTQKRHEDVRGLMKEEYKASHEVTVTGTRKDTVSAKVTEDYGELQTTSKGALVVNAQEGETHNVTGWYTNDASSGIHLTAPKISAFGDNEVHLKAAKITIEGTSEIELKTPKKTDTDTEKSILASAWKKIASHQEQYTTFSLGFTAIKIEGAGLTLANRGANLKNIGAHILGTPVKSETKGAEAGTGGVWSELRGIISLA